VNIGSRGVTGGGGIASRMNPNHPNIDGKVKCMKLGSTHCGYTLWSCVGGHWVLGAAALLKAVWWGMRLASLLMHLFVFVSQYQPMIG